MPVQKYFAQAFLAAYRQTVFLQKIPSLSFLIFAVFSILAYNNDSNLKIILNCKSQKP